MNSHMNVTIFFQHNRHTQSTAELIQTELDRGYIMGLYAKPPFSTHHASPVGIAVEKYSGKKWLIVDFLAPHDNEIQKGLNELIEKMNSLSYVK